jgi:small subunit ribosomal protein S27Ae
MAAAKKPASKGSSAPKKKKAQQIHKAYDVSGGSFKRKNKSCPKCGPGTFMADHKDRWSCGKCGFMEKK